MASSAPQMAASGSYAPGMIVRIHSLVQQPELNGLTGTVSSASTAAAKRLQCHAERVCVEVEGKKLSFLPANLMDARTRRFSLGDLGQVWSHWRQLPTSQPPIPSSHAAPVQPHRSRKRVTFAARVLVCEYQAHFETAGSPFWCGMLSRTPRPMRPEARLACR